MRIRGEIRKRIPRFHPACKREVRSTRGRLHRTSCRLCLSVTGKSRPGSVPGSSGVVDAAGGPQGARTRTRPSLPVAGRVLLRQSRFNKGTISLRCEKVKDQTAPGTAARAIPPESPRRWADRSDRPVPWSIGRQNNPPPENDSEPAAGQAAWADSADRTNRDSRIHGPSHPIIPEYRSLL